MNDKPIGAEFTPEYSVKKMFFSGDGSRIVTLSRNSTVQVWNADTGELEGKSLHSDYPVDFVIITHNGALIAIGGDSTVQLTNVATGEPVGMPLQHDRFLGEASFDVSGSRIATATANVARIRDVSTGSPVGSALTHASDCYIAGFNANGSLIVTVSGTTATIWNVATGDLVKKFLHVDRVKDAKLSADGSRFVTTSGDLVQVWDVETGERLGEPFRHAVVVNSAEFSADGERVVTASGDLARVWQVERIPELPKEWDQEIAPIIWAIAGQKFQESGELRKIGFSDRINFLNTKVCGTGRWADLIRWVTSSPSTRPVSPRSSRTARQIAEQERDFGTEKGIVASLDWDTSVPLARLLYAAFRTNARRAAFLREHDLKRLPDNASLWARASGSLLQQSQAALALGAAKKAVDIDPSLPAAQNALKAANEKTLVPTP